MQVRNVKFWMRAVTLALVAMIGTSVAAMAEPQWRMMTPNGWGPCATVEFGLNVAGLPGGSLNEVRAAFEASARMLNDGAGREVIRLATKTTNTDRDWSDRENVVLFRSSGPAGQAGVTPESSNERRIVDADVVLNSNWWTAASPEGRIVLLAHELGHALGLDHVADSHEIMSYGYIHDGDGVGPGTAKALQTLYSGDCDAQPRLRDSHDWSGLRPGGAEVIESTIGGTAADVRELALDVGVRLAMRHGGDLDWASHAVICRDDVFADCLAGSALTGDRAPIVYVPGGAAGQLDPHGDIMFFLENALPANAPVYVLGGPAAVSDRVLNTLKAEWKNTVRLSGATRFETAVAVSQKVVATRGAATTALLARADNPADAVSGGAAAAEYGMPVLLTGGEDLHAATRKALKSLGVNDVKVLGGTAAIAPSVVAQVEAVGPTVERIAGATRTGTSVAIAKELWNRTATLDGQGFVGVNGWHEETWALALASAPLAAQTDAPLLLTQKDGVEWGAPTTDDPTGDVGHYLATMPSEGTVRVMFVGPGNWADDHAAASFLSYLGMY